jgi:Trp operon repressor
MVSRFCAILQRQRQRHEENGDQITFLNELCEQQAEKHDGRPILDCMVTFTERDFFSESKG